MPSKSPAQANLMAACAHGAGYSSCPPTDVAKEFNKADEGRGIIGRAKGRHRKMAETMMKAKK